MATCAAVVFDTDFDGRTKPGDVMKMRFPELAKAASKAKQCAGS